MARPTPQAGGQPGENPVVNVVEKPPHPPPLLTALSPWGGRQYGKGEEEKGEKRAEPRGAGRGHYRARRGNERRKSRSREKMYVIRVKGGYGTFANLNSDPLR